MMKLFHGHEAHRFPDLYDQMLQLRARVFHDRLGWDVVVSEGRERDEFDDFNPLYGVALCPKGEQVLGSFRLLQTTGPTMLGTVFRQLLPDGLSVRSPIIWESTRFCVDTAATEAADHGLSNLTGRLLAAVYETGLYAGLSHVVTVIDVRMERVMRRAGCPMERLGPVVTIGKVGTVATLVPTTREAVLQIHERNGIEGPCVNRELVTELAA